MLSTTVIGHLGKDAEIKTMASGKTVVNFSVAHTESYINAQGVKTEKTTWLNCGWWNDGKLAPWLKKGSLVYLEGVPEARACNNATGEAKAELVLHVFKVDLLQSTAPKPDPAAGQQNDGAAR